MFTNVGEYLSQFQVNIWFNRGEESVQPE